MVLKQLWWRLGIPHFRLRSESLGLPNGHEAKHGKPAAGFSWEAGRKNWESTSQLLIFYTIYLPIINWEAGNNWDPRYYQLLFSIVRKPTVLGKKMIPSFWKMENKKTASCWRVWQNPDSRAQKKSGIELKIAGLWGPTVTEIKSLDSWTLHLTIFFQISGALFCLPQWLHVQLPSG